MQRNQNPRENPRRNAERDASQPIADSRADEDDDDLHDQEEQAPSFLTARELQARDPSKAPPAPEGGRDPFAEEEGDDKPRTKPGK